MKKGMIKLSVLYPNGDDVTFNMGYYLDRYIPLVKNLLGDHCKGVEVEKGLAGLGAPDTPAPTSYVAIYSLHRWQIYTCQ